MALTIINSTDKISNSRGDINNNFSGIINGSIPFTGDITIDGDIDLSSGQTFKINGVALDASDLSGANGIANQVLTSDGTNASWQNASGGIGTSGVPVDNDFAKFTDADTIEGRSYTQVKEDLSLDNVPNTDIAYGSSIGLSDLDDLDAGGKITSVTDPDVNQDAATKKYVDDNAGVSLWEVDGSETQLKTADEIDMRSKKIINVTDPANDQDAATKKYVDDNETTGLWEVDGSETQLKTADEVDMQSKKIINVTDPTSAQDAATKKYVDDLPRVYWEHINDSILVPLDSYAEFTVTVGFKAKMIRVDGRIYEFSMEDYDWWSWDKDSSHNRVSVFGFWKTGGIYRGMRTYEASNENSISIITDGLLEFDEYSSGPRAKLTVQSVSDTEITFRITDVDSDSDETWYYRFDLQVWG